ncbi:tropinone reductase homolog At5g06060-like [Pistacia vera]|uniref:tropinone reductase homolog At5g06060-like n=1 Tax=Pistacia vera TaxID=55513 RepID=UPI001262F963|nr:tropinone reductase homolog At5g06060-like [Pistacia vera]
MAQATAQWAQQMESSGHDSMSLVEPRTRACCGGLAEMGASVHTCSRNEVELNDASGMGNESFQIHYVSDVIQQIVQNFHYLIFAMQLQVHNVGTSRVKPIIEQNAEDFSVS